MLPSKTLQLDLEVPRPEQEKKSRINKHITKQIDLQANKKTWVERYLTFRPCLQASSLFTSTFAAQLHTETSNLALTHQ